MFTDETAEKSFADRSQCSSAYSVHRSSHQPESMSCPSKADHKRTRNTAAWWRWWREIGTLSVAP